MHNYKAFHGIKQHHSAEHNQERTVKMHNLSPSAHQTEESSSMKLSNTAVKNLWGCFTNVSQYLPVRFISSFSVDTVTAESESSSSCGVSDGKMI